MKSSDILPHREAVGRESEGESTIYSPLPGWERVRVRVNQHLLPSPLRGEGGVRVEYKRKNKNIR